MNAINFYNVSPLMLLKIRLGKFYFSPGNLRLRVGSVNKLVEWETVKREGVTLTVTQIHLPVIITDLFCCRFTKIRPHVPPVQRLVQRT